MSEKMPTFETEMTKEGFVDLATELSKRAEGFAFTGITEASYAKIKATDDEYPGYATPIDELIKRFEAEGMKVVLGDHPMSGNVLIVPKGSTDTGMDSVQLKDLDVSEVMDPALKKLIANSKRLFVAKT